MLISPAGMATGKFILKDPLNLAPMGLKKLEQFQLDDNFIIHNSVVFTKDRRFLLFFLDPVFPGSNTKENLGLLESIDRAISEIQSTEQEINIEYYGGSAVAVANSVRVKKDIALTLSVALVLFLVIVKFFKTGKPPVSPEETLEIFAFMEAADETPKETDFAMPSGVITAKIDPASGLLAYPGQEDAIEDQLMAEMTGQFDEPEVEDVVERQFLALQLLGARHGRRRRVRLAVERGGLVRVLAVPQVLRLGPGDLQRLGVAARGVRAVRVAVGTHDRSAIGRHLQGARAADAAGGDRRDPRKGSRGRRLVDRLGCRRPREGGAGQYPARNPSGQRAQPGRCLARHLNPPTTIDLGPATAQPDRLHRDDAAARGKQCHFKSAC